MQKLVWQNANGDSIDLTSGNYGITQWEGFSNTSLNIQSQQVPFQDGAVFLDALLNQRELSVTLKMQDNGNLEERYRMRRELIHILNPKLGEGYLIYTNDFISKRIKCVAQVPLFETHNSDTRGTPKASLSWTACEPYWEDLEETIVDILAGETTNIINNGDYKLGVKIEILNNAPSIRLLNITTKKQFQTRDIAEGKYILNTLIGEKSFQKIKSAIEALDINITSATINNENKAILSGNYNFFETDNYSYIRSISLPNILESEIRSIYFDKENNFYLVASGYNVYKTDNLTDFTLVYTSSTGNVTNIKKINNKYWAFASKPAYSNDGTNWTQINNPVTMSDGCYTGSYYITVNNENIYKSTNGTDFTLLATLSNSGIASRIIYIPQKNIFIAIGNNIYKSTNATSWTTIAVSSSYLRDIIYVEESERVIIGGNSGKIYTSTDETNFTEIQLDTQEDIISLKQEDNIYAYCKNGNVYISGLGECWSNTIKIGNNLNSPMQKLKQKNNILFGIGSTKVYKYDNTNLYSFSVNENVSSIEQIWIAEDLSLFVIECIVLGYTYIYSSNNLENWTQSALRSVRLVEDYTQKIIAYSTTNFYSSEDGINFSPLAENTNGIMRIVYVKNWNLFIGYKYVGNNRYVYKSSDCITWTQVYNYTRNSSDIKMKATENCCFIFENYSNIETGEITQIIASANGNDWHKLDTGNLRINDVIEDEYGYLLISSGSIYRLNSSFSKLYKEDYIFGKITCLCKKENDIYIGGVSVLGILSDDDYENKIEKVSTVSDMNFSLEIGENKLSLITEGVMTVSYRQKYLGV